MHRFEVGQLYNPSRRSWREGSNYNFRGGRHELLLCFGDPSRHEVEAVREGEAEFALIVEPPAIMLCYRFGAAGRGIPWSDATFSYHLLPAAERILPIGWEEGSPETRALLPVFLVDAGDGILRAMRQVTLSPEFTRSLHRAIWDQAHAPWDEAAYNRSLADLYRRYPTTPDLVAAAKARTKGGA